MCLWRWTVSRRTCAMCPFLAQCTTVVHQAVCPQLCVQQHTTLFYLHHHHRRCRHEIVDKVHIKSLKKHTPNANCYTCSELLGLHQCIWRRNQSPLVLNEKIRETKMTLDWYGITDCMDSTLDNYNLHVLLSNSNVSTMWGKKLHCITSAISLSNLCLFW